MSKMFVQLGVLASLTIVFSATTAAAKDWWPVEVKGTANGKETVVKYEPLERASKPWRICVLFPHMKDSIWLAVDYGIVEEARRTNVSMTLYEAGGYENLTRQLSQFDDCMAQNFDAFIIGQISEGGFAQKFKEAKAAGKPVIVVLNPLDNPDVTSRVYPYISDMTKASAQFLIDQLNGQPGKVVTFPGPGGSGWAELFNDNFKMDLKGQSNITVLGERFGDSGVAVQLGLIQDALQAYPDMNVIYGGAPAIEAAIGATAAVGRTDVVFVPAYENQAMLDAVKEKQIGGFVTQYPALEGRITVDLAVRALEKKDPLWLVATIPAVVSDLNKIDTTLLMAPSGFEAVYSVEAK